MATNMKKKGQLTIGTTQEDEKGDQHRNNTKRTRR
jgi:hypothetical protein